MNNPYVKDDIYNKVIWAIFSKNQLTKLPKNPRSFLSLSLNHFRSDLDPRTVDKIEDCFRRLDEKKCAKLERYRHNMPVLINFDMDELKKEALSNINQEKLKDFINGISVWNTSRAIPINDILHAGPMGFDIPKVKTRLHDIGLLIGDNSQSYCPHNYFVWGAIVNSPTDYARRLFNIPIFSSKNPESGLYITYPDIYVIEANDQDGDDDH